jgi:hypothetical protein
MVETPQKGESFHARFSGCKENLTSMPKLLNSIKMMILPSEEYR